MTIRDLCCASAVCGRYALAHVAGFWSRFAVMDRTAQLEPRFNIAPTQMAPTITSQSPNRAMMMRWGFIPFWAKDPKIGNRLINARAESIDARPAYRMSYKWKRCLVPATGFYEWQRRKNDRIPYYIHMKNDSLFAFAGLYDRWKHQNLKEVLSFTIVTTDANSVTSKIHDRMPVILRPESEDLWLSHDPISEQDRKKLLVPYPSRYMESYEVSREVNNPKNESADLVKPIVD